MEVLWKSGNGVLLDLPEDIQYYTIVKYLIMLYLRVFEDIPNVDRIAGAENPALSAHKIPLSM